MTSHFQQIQQCNTSMGNWFDHGISSIYVLRNDKFPSQATALAVHQPAS